VQLVRRQFDLAVSPNAIEISGSNVKFNLVAPSAAPHSRLFAAAANTTTRGPSALIHPLCVPDKFSACRCGRHELASAGRNQRPNLGHA